MLHSLSIQNYALIDELNIGLSKGFTVITGETGAGKSILLGALSLLIGKRADLSVLNDGKKKCIVEGVFDISRLNLLHFFSENDLDYEDFTIIRREIVPSGKSRAFVNDTPVKLDMLKILGEKLVDIHSQNQTLELGQAQFQLEVLDDHVNKPKILNEYRKLFNQYRELTAALLRITSSNEKAKRDEDYYRFQYEELEAVDLKGGEFEILIEREKLLSHAEEVAQGVEFANQLLSDNDQSITDKLGLVRDSLSRIMDYHSGFAELVKRLESATIEIDDIATEIRQLAGQTELYPDELQEVTERLGAFYRLQQKHHVTSVEELLALQEDYLTKLNGITLNENQIFELTEKRKEAKAKANTVADELNKLRAKDAPVLASSILNLLVLLGMKDAAFQVVVQKLDELTPTGKSKVRFMFSANKGVTSKEIGHVASGGEKSRLMLAIKSLINKENVLPTVVFDEIDAGVSGETAGKVGNILKSMSAHHQLIAISHLPQIAAKAAHHYKVYKTTDNGRTITMISLLSDNERVDEIAKLLSDEKVTKAAKTTARELLSIES